MNPDNNGDSSPQPADAATRLLSDETFTLQPFSKLDRAAAPGTLFNEFEVVRVIGEGGFGIVYEAKDRSLLRHVALKEYMPANLVSRSHEAGFQILSPRYQEAFDLGLRSFVNEARLLVRFDHPSLVKAYSFWEANGTAYMVMPLYRGFTLKEQLKRFGNPPPENWLLALLEPLTSALHELHAENCFHRDIAPDNIFLLEESGTPVLLDFGAARQVIGDLTQSLTTILKPGFAPVEQYGDSPEMSQGAWTDIYALAATIHFAITGATPPAAVGRLIKDSYVPLAARGIAGYGRRLLSALDHALGVRPTERTKSMAEFRTELGFSPVGSRHPTKTQGQDAWVETQIIAGSKRGRGKRPVNNPGWSAKRLPFFVLSSGGVCVAGAAFWWLSTSPAPPTSPTLPAAPAIAIASAKLERAYPAPSAASSASGPTAHAALNPAAEVPPTTFDASAQFLQIVAKQTPGYEIQALTKQSVLKIGKDRFNWQIRSARDGYVHIIALDPEGSLLLVFPNSKDDNNRIRAGQSIDLPRKNWELEASEPAGREELLVVVSAHPRVFDGLEKKRVSYFYELPTGSAALSAQANWPHGTPWLLGAVLQCTGAVCQDYGAATVSMEVRP